MTNAPVELAETILRAAVKIIVESGKQIADVEQAIAVVKAETIAFITGPEYANERTCLELNSLSPQTILASVVMSCVLKINTKA